MRRHCWKRQLWSVAAHPCCAGDVIVTRLLRRVHGFGRRRRGSACSVSDGLVYSAPEQGATLTLTNVTPSSESIVKQKPRNHS